MKAPLAGLDPGRSKCGLARCDADGERILAAGVLSPEQCGELLASWWQEQRIEAVLLGDGTGSAPWRQRLLALGLPVLLVPEAGTTLAARNRYWELEPAQGEIHVIDEDQHLGRLKAVPIERGADRAAAVVHEGLGHQQPQAPITLTHFGQQAVELVLTAEGDTTGGGQALQSHETDVVTRSRVLVARIAQAHQQLQGGLP